MELLTKKQEQVLDYTKKFIADKGYPPTVREIGAGLQLNSPATIHSHLKNLMKKGYVNMDGSKNRTLEVLVKNEYLNTDDSVVEVPLLGMVSAGSPIEAIERPNEFFSLPSFLVPKQKEVFTLNISGESMINAGILDGDIVVVERCNTARNGEKVVAMTDENEVTLKTFYKEKDHIRLQPENDTLEPIILNNVTIIGKAIGLYRKI